MPLTFLLLKENMKIKVERVNDAFQMVGINENGNQVALDASTSIGGGDSAFRPMQMLLVGLASCSAIDILNILYKQKQEVLSFEVEVEGDRTEEIPSIFKNIRVLIKVSGGLSQKKLEKAIHLTKEKYCSVYQILNASATINYDYELKE